MSAVRINILHVEDDPDDALLFQHACGKVGSSFELRTVQDGEQAIAYLSGAREFSDREKYPLPQLLLLDLKMPRVSGFDVLAWLRKESQFKQLPVLVLTSSNHENDIRRAYELGANSYLVKPIGFDRLVDLAKNVHDYWLNWNVRV